MARKADLRIQRTGTVINIRSKKQERRLTPALRYVEDRLVEELGVDLSFRKMWYLKDIVTGLRAELPSVEFHHHFHRWLPLAYH